MIEPIQTDMLVVGGGGAGFRAAISAAEKKVPVLLLSKGPIARCGASPMAGADFTLDGKSMNSIEGLPGDVNDSMEKVFNDIITQGWYLNNQKLAEQYIQRAPRCLRELIEWGIKIKAADERMIFTSGIGIMDALLKKAKAVGVEMREDIAALELLTRNNQISGVLALELRTGKFIHIKAKAVVIATGGWHKAFWPNTGMRDLSGEGIAMALRAGAPIGNMEFITFCCNVFYSPPIWRGSLAPDILRLICGGRLTNNRNEDILDPYDPYLVEKGTRTEWNKSFISHVSAKEIRAGYGFENGGIHYTRGKTSWEEIELVCSILFPRWKYKAMDLSPWAERLEKNLPVEVGPAVEYFEGGIVVNERFETEIKGLYAAGECTLGVFGANRVFAAITEMLVHGVDVGENAADFAKETGFLDSDSHILEFMVNKYEAPLLRKKGIHPAQLRRQVQEQAHQCLGPIRTRNELDGFLSFLEDIKNNSLPLLATTSKSRMYNKEWMDALELPNMIQLLESATRSAQVRTESRGVHFREDYPVVDNKTWLKESVVRFKDNAIEVSHRPVTVTTMTPPNDRAPYLEFMVRMMKAHSEIGGKH